MKLRKAQARLKRRIEAYEHTIKTVSAERARGFIKPGSSKKSAPKGRA